jgi:hypothetical protein
MATPMIATVPAHSRSSVPRIDFEYLLLGDLRELLNESHGRERDRWLLATLDMLLVFRPRSSVVYLPVIPRDADLGIRPAVEPELQLPFDRLQRLRDRLAHRAPYEVLAQELIVELRLYFEELRSKREATSPVK